MIIKARIAVNCKQVFYTVDGVTHPRFQDFMITRAFTVDLILHCNAHSYWKPTVTTERQHYTSQLRLL